MLLVHGQSARLFARRQRPAFYHGSFFGVDAGDFALVFNVYKNTAFTVGNAKLWFAIEGDIADNLVIRGIDDRGVLAATVKRKDSLGRWIIKNGITIFALDFDFCRLLQGLQVKYRYRVVAPVAGKALAKILGQSNPVDSGRIRNIANHG